MHAYYDITRGIDASEMSNPTRSGSFQPYGGLVIALWQERRGFRLNVLTFRELLMEYCWCKPGPL